MFKNKKGITLVELICTLAIAVVIGGAVIMAIPLISSGYTNTAITSNAKSAVSAIQKIIESDVRLGTEPEIFTASAVTAENPDDEYLGCVDGVFHSRKGSLAVEGANVDAPLELDVMLVRMQASYSNLYFEVLFEAAEGSNVLNITVTAYPGSYTADGRTNVQTSTEALYTQTATVKLLNADSISGTSGNYLKYTL